MERITTTELTRRQLQKLILTAPAPLASALVAGKLTGATLAQDSADPEATPVLAPTPECVDADDFEETVAQTEGPFFTPNTPERTSFMEDAEPDSHELLVTGYVYSIDCEPVSGALLEFWHADAAGAYDNQGYRFRGHQFADDEGRYELTTIYPGLYTGRTRHIHVKVRAPNGPVLTSQLYFPDEPGNDSDGIFDEELLMHIEPGDDQDNAYFTFAVQPG